MRHTENWTAVSTLLGLFSSAYPDLHYYRSNQQPQNAEPSLYHWATEETFISRATSSQVGVTYPRRLNLMGRK